MRSFLLVFWLFGAIFVYGKTLTVGSIDHSGKVTTYPCFAYIAHHLTLDPSLDPHTLFVSDFDDGEMIDPLKSFFVLNSHYPSACSQYPIVAFRTEAGALRFVKRYGGSIRDFDFALFVAKKDLEKDQKTIQNRLQKDFQRGETIFHKWCKADKEKCPKLTPKNKHDLHTYLHNQGDVRLQTKKKIESIDVPQDAKCPVCGMFVAKYPKWAAEITYADGKKVYFDGVKDMMKFLFKSEILVTTIDTTQKITSIFVTDYYTTQKLEAKKVWYVVGSNVFGPMGHELIPFGDRDDAESFRKDHGGKMVVEFAQITPALIKGLD